MRPPCPSSEDNKENRHPAEYEPEDYDPDEEEEDPEEYEPEEYDPDEEEEDPVEDEPLEEEPMAPEALFQPPFPARIGHTRTYPDSELQEVLDRFEASSSISPSPDGFGAGSSLAAALQAELTSANLYISVLEASAAVNNAFEVMQTELAERVAGAGVDRVMMGIAADESARTMGQLWMGVGALIVLVVALLLRGW